MHCICRKSIAAYPADVSEEERLGDSISDHHRSWVWRCYAVKAEGTSAAPKVQESADCEEGWPFNMLNEYHGM